jgi:hypothetical protein
MITFCLHPNSIMAISLFHFKTGHVLHDLFHFHGEDSSFAYTMLQLDF